MLGHSIHRLQKLAGEDQQFGVTVFVLKKMRINAKRVDMMQELSLNSVMLVSMCQLVFVGSVDEILEMGFRS